MVVVVVDDGCRRRRRLQFFICYKIRHVAGFGCFII